MLVSHPNATHTTMNPATTIVLTMTGSAGARDDNTESATTTALQTWTCARSSLAMMTKTTTATASDGET